MSVYLSYSFLIDGGEKMVRRTSSLLCFVSCRLLNIPLLMSHWKKERRLSLLSLSFPALSVTDRSRLPANIFCFSITVTRVNVLSLFSGVSYSPSRINCSICPSCDPHDSQRYRRTYLVDSVFPAPDSPDTMTD